jgi:beta-N-acetylhexosaminidase
LSPQPLRRQIGQLLIGSFRGSTPPAEIRALARDFDLGGVSLFNKNGNIESPDQVAALAFDTKRLGLELPAWVAIDQEGGRVARLRAPFTEWPPMSTLGRSNDEALARRFARALAEELVVVGVSLDYAPVLDVHTNPANPVIGDRALADRAEVVARLGRVIIEEVQAGGVAACGKHFPGHGDTDIDSHFDLPIVERSPDDLRAVEFVPFRAAVESEVAFIMTAHVLVTAFDDQRPATVSPKVVKELLRGELNYQGVIVSDDLEMNALSRSLHAGDAAVAALNAGCDVVLICSGDVDRQVRVLEALIHAVESGGLAAPRVDEALSRHRRAKERFLRPRDGRPTMSPLADAWRPPTSAALHAIIGSDSHRAIADQMAHFT